MHRIWRTHKSRSGSPSIPGLPLIAVSGLIYGNVTKPTKSSNKNLDLIFLCGMLALMTAVDYIFTALLVSASFASGVSFGAFIMHVLDKKNKDESK